MVEPAIIVVRLLQYLGGALLGGVPLFCAYAAPRLWPRGLLAGAALTLALASLAAVALQSILFAGSLDDGLRPAALGEIVRYLPLGKAALVRTALALGALVLLALPDRPVIRAAIGALGLGSLLSLAWLGHAGASEYVLQLAADVAHVAAAGIWLGALAGLVLLAAEAREALRLPELRSALERFSALGIPLVLVLLASGLANSWYLIGSSDVRHIVDSVYGRLLLAKLALFCAMLGLAALNRYRLTPSLAAATLRYVRASVAAEAVLGAGVLALVSWLGTLEPPTG